MFLQRTIVGLLIGTLALSGLDGCKRKAPKADDDDEQESTEQSSKTKGKSSKGKSKGKKSKQADDDSDQSADGDDKAEADDLLLTKLNEYIGPCINDFARRRMMDSRSRYYEWVDEKKGPEGKSNVYGLYEVDETFPKRCGQAAEKAKKLKPQLKDLESGIDDYLAAFGEAAPIVNEAHKYYDQKDYADDKFKKGKELHPKLIAAWKKVSEADHAFMQAYRAQKDGADSRDLARLEKTGPRARYLTKGTVLKAKGLVEMVDKPKSVDDFFALDSQKLLTDAGALDQMNEELIKLDKSGDATAKKFSSLSSYTSSVTAFVAECKNVARRIRDKKKFSSTELDRLGTSAGWMTEGSPDRLQNKLDDLINNYNRL